MSASPESLYPWKTIAFPQIQHNTPTICQNTTTDWCKHTLGDDRRRLRFLAHTRCTSDVMWVRWHQSIKHNHHLYAINLSHKFVLLFLTILNWCLSMVDLYFGTKWSTQNRVLGRLLSFLLLTFLRAQLQGGQSYMYKVTLLISFVTHKIYTTSPSWRPVSLLLPVAVREHR